MNDNQATTKHYLRQPKVFCECLPIVNNRLDIPNIIQSLRKTLKEDQMHMFVLHNNL